MYVNYISNCYEECVREISLYENYVSHELFEALHRLEKALEPETVPMETKHYIAEKLISVIDEKNYYIGILLYSSIIQFTRDTKWMVSMLRYILENINHFTPNNLYFLYTQMAYLPMVNQHMESAETKLLMEKLFQEIIQQFHSNNEKKYISIPITERDQDFIIVLTEQFLGETHGPTKTAMDRCRVILEKMGKKVLLINTAETLSIYLR